MRNVGLNLMLCAIVWLPVYAATSTKSVTEIVAQQKEIRSEVEARNGRYEEMPSVKRRLILDKQDRLFVLLNGKSSIDELSLEQKTEAFNALQSINAAITNREDERIICERQKKTGSNRVERVCKSVAQIKADREAARANMQVNQGICNSGACKPEGF